jgi:nucleoside-diphosphate-sugar epimerase
VHIDDLVDGVLRVIEAGEHLEIYHVGNEEEVSVADLVAMMGRHVDRQVQSQPGRLQPGGTARRCPDIRKLRALGYAPRIPLEVGLRKTMSWYLDHPISE